MDHRSLKFLTFNVRSLVDRSRQIELKNTLLHNNIDIAFIQECHLRSNMRVKISGYTFVYDNSPTGVAIFIKDSIQFKRVSVPATGINTTLIEISSNNSTKKYLLGSVYIPCSYPVQRLDLDLNTLLQLSSNFDGFIFGGDLNSKSPTWGDSYENSNGRVLWSWLSDNTMDVIRICDTSPSYPSGTSYLDHFLLSNHLINSRNPNYTISTRPTFSDHFPIKLDLKLDHLNIDLTPPQFFISYKNTNWHNFRQDIDVISRQIMPSINRNLTNDEIDTTLNGFKSHFSNIHEIHSEKFKIEDRSLPYSDKIKKILQIKHQWQRNLKKIFHRSGNRTSREYSILSNQIQLLKIIIKELVKIETAQIFNDRLQKIKPSPSAFKEIYRFTGSNKSSFCRQINHANNTITNSNEIANHFKNFYSTIFEGSTTLPASDEHNSTLLTCINSTPTHIYSFDENFNSLHNPDTYHFTSSENIKNIIFNINSKKSSGPDEISNFIIKRFPESTINLLTCLFNNCINNGYFPKQWKVAKIIPIKKKTTNCNVDDFRPISLLSNIGKILEVVLKEKLNNELTIDPISNYQFGFKSGHSTQHALLKFHNDVTTNLRSQSCTVAISLDIQKAFDSVSHLGILFKLIQLGVDPFIIKMLKSFFNSRKFMVQIRNTSSSLGHVNSGVPQGSILAPYLFNLFLHDFPHMYQHSKAILYADDCIIYAHNPSPAIA